MAIIIRGSSDEGLLSIQQTLLPYDEQYPEATIELYRRNSISIRIRVVDPSFDGMEKIRPPLEDLGVSGKAPRGASERHQHGRAVDTRGNETLNGQSRV